MKHKIKRFAKAVFMRMALALCCWFIAFCMPIVILFCAVCDLLIGLPRAAFAGVGAKAFIIDRCMGLACMVKITWYLLILDIDKACEVVEL